MLRSWICIDPDKDTWAYINGTMQRRLDNTHLVLVGRTLSGGYTFYSTLVNLESKIYPIRYQAIHAAERAFEAAERT